ncbi:MAG: hypothetical protein HKO75_08655 [Flavobacteriaceae bacterium]|nr:hypothetical protein [Muriicola sp.]NNK10564.1 hypothetical protein [Flavobacteriaceae bacterium]NNL39915.1 hypothetical protein [Flavobacteriaceae bacterium]
MLLLHSCVSYSTGLKIPRKQFPEYKACGQELLIADPPSEHEVARLDNLNDMGYSATYHRIIFSSDSLEKEEIRRFTSRLSNYIVKEMFPEVKKIPEDKFTTMSYYDYYLATKTLYPSYRDHKLSTRAIENLLVPSSYRKQLFMDLSTYIHNGDEFSNYLHLYVFDTKKKSILYYDFLKYTCDIRDSTAFSVVMNYALKKLKMSPLKN